MYQDFFSLQQQPFLMQPDPDFMFFTDHHKEALAHLTYGLQGNGGFVVLTGEVGTGKTTVCQYLLQELPADTDIASITNTAVSEIALLVDICDQFSIEYNHENISLKVMFDALASWMLINHQWGRHAIVLIDEAQHLSFAALEQLRLITNIESNNVKPLQIILIGQNALQKKLLTTELRQLSQRITARYHLRAMNKRESNFYINHRLNKSGAKWPIFDLKTTAMIFKASRGVPRLINQICDRCLLSAYTQSSITVTQSITKKVINETELTPQENNLKVYIPYFLMALMGILLGVLILNNQIPTIHQEEMVSETSQMRQEWREVFDSADQQSNQNLTDSDWSLTSSATLQAIPETNFSLQLASLDSKKLVTAFFVTYPTLQKKSYFYRSNHYAESKFIVLLGNFNSYKMAKQASKKLSSEFPNIDPWIKDYRTIQHDIK
ncbi:MAG: AAA family ATPase [Psychromonas sp.]